MKFLTSLFAIGLTSFVFCQTYTFSAFTTGYTDLVASTSLNNGATWDDPNYSVPIGFNFEFFGESLTSIVISDDGLGGLLKEGACGVDLDESYLIAYGADIIDRGYDGTASLSNISHKTEGTIGSRICKIEWNNVGFWDGTNDPNGNKIDYLNFQLWLYETTNAIEIRFGPKSITEPLIDFEDEPGSYIALIHGIDCATYDVLGHELILGGTPASPDFYDNIYSLSDTILTVNGVVPPLTTYRFLPAATTSQEELSEVSSFSIVPNPAEDQLLIILDKNQTAEIRSAQIIDVNGEIVLEGFNFNQEISISNLHSGMYFVQISMDSGEMYSEKFTKR